MKKYRIIPLGSETSDKVTKESKADFSFLWMSFRSHRQMLVERAVLTYPDYICELDNMEYPSQPAYIRDRIDKCIQVFDEKGFPFANCRGKIYGEPCVKQPVCLSVLGYFPRPWFWCEECARRLRRRNKMIDILSKYREATRYVRCGCRNRKGAHRYLIKKMYEAKGLTGRLTEKKILSFFYG